MTFADTILFAFLAALLSLDQMACFQMLLSRPIFSALILGAVFGDITEAALVGICFEFLFVRSIPLKERTAADPTLATAAVLGGIWGSSAAGYPVETIHPLAAAPFAAALGLLAAFMSKWFDLRLRGANTIFFHRMNRIGSVQLLALGVLFAKSFGFYLLTVLAVQGALPKIMSALGPVAPTAAALAWVALICICVAYAAAPFLRGRGGVLWIAGLLIGAGWVMFSRILSQSLAWAAGCILVTCVVFELIEFARYTRRSGAAT